MRKRKLRNRERGMALLIALMALLLISAIGLGIMYMSSGETSINGNYKDSQAAFFGMRAGLEEGRDRLRTNATVPIPNLPTTQLPGNPGSILYILNPAGASDTVDPTTPGTKYYDDELCHETVTGLVYSDPGTGAPCNSVPPLNSVVAPVYSTSPYHNTASALNYKWVRYTLKQNNTFPKFLVDSTQPVGSQVCWNSTTNQEVVVSSLGYANCTLAHAALANVGPLYIITSLAITLSGSRRIGQYEAAGVTILPPPGALSLDGPNATFPTAPNSNNFAIDGVNGQGGPPAIAGCVPPATAVPAIGVDDQAGVNNLLGNPVGTGTIPQKRYGLYTGCGAAGSCAPAAAVSPSVVNDSSQLTGIWSNPAQLNSLMSTMGNSADLTLTCGINGVGGAACGFPAQGLGTDANPQITFVNGDFSMGPNHGAGVLIVTGTMSFNGNAGFDGIIFVVGQGSFQMTGGGGAQFNGQVFIADTNSHVTPYNTLAALGSPTISWNGGGGNGIYYNSCWADDLLSMHYSVVASREEMY